MITRVLRRLPHALRGLTQALLIDFSFKTQCYGGLLTTTLVILITWPLSSVEGLFLGLGFALLLITELQNSSMEATLDHLHPDHHEMVGYSKDLAAAAVLVAAILYGGIVTTILGNHFFPDIILHLSDSLTKS